MPLPILDASQRILAQRKSYFLGTLPQRDVVVLAAGEILKRRAVTFRWKRAQIHLQTFVTEFDAGLVRSLAQNLLRLGMSHEFFERVRSAGSSHQQIQVADCLPATPQASGGRNFLDTGECSREIRSVHPLFPARN